MQTLGSKPTVRLKAETHLGSTTHQGMDYAILRDVHEMWVEYRLTRVIEGTVLYALGSVERLDVNPSGVVVLVGDVIPGSMCRRVYVVTPEDYRELFEPTSP